jgi:hypothetical protein
VSSSPNSGNTTYTGPSIDLASTSQGSVEQRMPVGGTLDQLSIRLGSDPGNGNSWTVTVMNGTTASTVTCAISGSSASTCNDLTHAVAFAAGDLISIRIVPASNPDSAGTFRWTARFTAAS